MLQGCMQPVQDLGINDAVKNTLNLSYMKGSPAINPSVLQMYMDACAGGFARSQTTYERYVTLDLSSGNFTQNSLDDTKVQRVIACGADTTDVTNVSIGLRLRNTETNLSWPIETRDAPLTGSFQNFSENFGPHFVIAENFRLEWNFTGGGAADLGDVYLYFHQIDPKCELAL